jgi:hypothetical protein
MLNTGLQESLRATEPTERVNGSTTLAAALQPN